MTTLQLLEVAVAAALMVGAVILYRRRGSEDKKHGSQGAVILLVIGLIMAIHGLGLLEYRPSQGEIDRAVARN